MRPSKSLHNVVTPGLSSGVGSIATVAGLLGRAKKLFEPLRRQFSIALGMLDILMSEIDDQQRHSWTNLLYFGFARKLQVFR
jgi:hypothetical protein